MNVLNKKIFLCLSIISCILLTGLTACSGKDTADKRGDFSFESVEGYAFSDITDENCTIVSDENSETVGGVEITNLKPGELDDATTTNIMLYLQDEFHKTNNVEFMASRWGDEKPIVIINLTKADDEAEQKASFYHVFFEKESSVYHMWFDLSVIDQEIAEQFISTVAMNGN